ncbi:Uncharacterized protein dnl_23120 [Desulfonema limicola]|uniref:Uncharacterized protein n=1 Tax=Desulfonema limicola TaxID=45656 RepID=A0A975B744_9BACT|nr:Uncharacterized protein dnl_23120 [Desulfonema limicola]
MTAGAGSPAFREALQGFVLSRDFLWIFNPCLKQILVETIINKEKK